MTTKHTEIVTEIGIEDRIKDIILTKLKDKKFKDNLENNNIEIVDKLFEIFPELKDKKKYLNKTSLQNIINGESIESKNEILLEEFTYNETVYFKDSNGGIWNEDADLVGIVNGVDKEGMHVCLFFDEKYNIDIDINKILSQ